MFGWLSKFNPFAKLDDDYTLVVAKLTVIEAYKRLAIDSCINLIADAFARCEFKTYQNKKSSKEENYFLMNIAPNENQNAIEFWKKIIYKLYRKNEVLVIMHKNKWYIADSFSVEKFAFKENKYTNVVIETLSLGKTYQESEVLYFKLNEEDIMSVINTLYTDYGKLIASAKDIYKRSNAKRLVIKGKSFRPQIDAHQKAINDMLTAQFKPFLEADNAGAVFQLQDGYELEDLSGVGKAGVNKNDSRDIRHLVDDVFDFVASALHVPRGLFKGDVVDVSELTNNLIMFVILPLTELISVEINKKYYGPDNFTKGNYVKIDASSIKVTDLKDLAEAMDKLFAIGALSVNDIIERIGGERIEEEWADKRYVTKNYQDAATAAEGGE
ncbi:phage portal protein [Bacillus sp. Hm123]|uniref:phage portal protein n=1 Tax=Bacillus sp. Hm123 TaxID=3450745 RepID=UPI003F4211A0